MLNNARAKTDEVWLAIDGNTDCTNKDKKYIKSQLDSILKSLGGKRRL